MKNPKEFTQGEYKTFLLEYIQKTYNFQTKDLQPDSLLIHNVDGLIGLRQNMDKVKTTSGELLYALS